MPELSKSTTNLNNMEADMALDNMKTPETATPIRHGTATIQFNGLTVKVGFDIHAETPLDQKEELIRLAALQCVSDFFDIYRGGDAATEESEAA